MSSKILKVKEMQPNVTYQVVGDKCKETNQHGAWNGALVVLAQPKLSEINSGAKFVEVGEQLYVIKCIKSGELNYPLVGIYFGKKIGLRVVEYKPK